MMTTTNRKLAKGFWPVLLLSAALSLPAVSVAAPTPKDHGKARAAEPWNQKQQNKAAKQQLRAERQQQKQQQRAQRQAVKVQRQAVRQNRAAKQIVIVPSRRAARVPVAVRPGRVVQAPVFVRPIRKVAPAPIIVQPGRQVYRAPVYSTPYVANRAIRTRPWYGWNNRSNYSRYGSGEFQLEGTFIGQQYGCALLQDNQGQVIPLLNNPGDLARGDHLLLTGRIQNSSVCGTAFRIFNVDDVWNDR